MKLRHTTISIPAEHVWLGGELDHAPDVRALAVILRPSCGQFQHLPEAHLAAALQEAGFATLGIDLLTQYEAQRDPDAAFNVPQMANRILAVAEWISHQPPLARLSVGLLAHGTASGAAVRAAWKAPERFGAIVCRSGRPDLAGAAPLKGLNTPIRFIAGSLDTGLQMLRLSYDHLTADRDWQILDGVDTAEMTLSALGRCADLAIDWLALKLPPPTEPEPEAEAAPEPTGSPATEDATPTAETPASRESEPPPG